MPVNQEAIAGPLFEYTQLFWHGILISLNLMTLTTFFLLTKEKRPLLRLPLVRVLRPYISNVNQKTECSDYPPPHAQYGYNTDTSGRTTDIG